MARERRSGCPIDSYTVSKSDVYGLYTSQPKNSCTLSLPENDTLVMFTFTSPRVPLA